MRLTVLGNNGPYPSPGGACSGYLIEDKDTKILVDCGNGVLSRLLKVCDLEQIDGIILSHLHSDHISDIFILKYVLGLSKKREYSNKPIPLYAPSDDKETLNKFEFNNAFKIFSINENEKVQINDLEVSFKKMTHPVEAYAIKIESENKTFVYSGDTSYNENISKFAHNADLFLCEAGVLEEDRTEDTPHLSAKQAGEVATKAAVKRLLLTHFWPEYKQERILEEAKETFDSILELSEQMKTYYI
ncbi:MBL fold metallo-hydrolase [Thermohalobacter berrensis]|uniref:Metallo-beta-lactamase domain-containing protein n=1 Tax=Thermohalobacter berrensis TaxID=99594 RepID=A0A419T568_9FIRM|nr:MBL fold metallo-hydrolase [Thermohalobacter berrensis]RKD32585.1 hypothetical protein BET03_10950 [Thermohalobacter berrensis]